MVRKGMEGRASQLQVNGTSEGQLLFSFTRDHYWNAASERGRVYHLPQNPLSQSPECQQEALEKPESGESSSWYVFKHDWVPPGVYVGDSLWMDVSA